MKCVQFSVDIPQTAIGAGSIYRTSDESAAAIVREGKADYISRSQWRDYWETVSGDREDGYLFVRGIQKFLGI